MFEYITNVCVDTRLKYKHYCNNISNPNILPIEFSSDFPVKGGRCSFSFGTLYPNPSLNRRHLETILDMLSQRFGEAKNPGPNFPSNMDGLLAVGTINPTSIVSKMDSLVDLGPGIWSMSETSATFRQQQIAKSFFKKKSRSVVFGAPVRAHANKFNALRGVAQGVGLFSHLNLLESNCPFFTGN